MAAVDVVKTCNYEDCDGDWHACPHCGGEGYIVDDCFEDSCPCADPETDHDIIECDYCRGKGGWKCPAAA